MKKRIVAILIALVVVTSVSLAAVLPTSAEGESTNPAVRIAYEPEEDAKFKFMTVYPIEIEIKEKDDTFLVSIDYNSETEKSKALYLNLEYAELTPHDDFISVEMRDEAGKIGTDFAEEQIMAISDWGQLQVIVKESGGKKRTISAHTASFALSDEEYTPKGETPGISIPTPIPIPTATPTQALSPTKMPTSTPFETATPVSLPEEKGIPGLEGIFAIVGLLAIAYLLRRSK